jgi:hypothetical protein
VYAFLEAVSPIYVLDLAMVKPPVLTDIASIGLLERDLLIVSTSLTLALYPVLELSLAVWARNRGMVRNVILIKDHLCSRAIFIAWAPVFRPYHDRAETCFLEFLSTKDWNELGQAE